MTLLYQSYLAAALAFTSLFPPAPPRNMNCEVDVTQNLTHPFAAVCQVTVHNPPRGAFLWRTGGSSGGSGTLIGLSGDKALVLTVHHVAQEVGAPAVCHWTGNPPCKGTVLVVNSDADIALLIVDAPKGIRPVPVALANQTTGPFTMAGYPGYDRKTLRLQTGEFLAIDEGTLVVAIRPEKGMSGGPCYDRYGNVCGAVSTFSLRSQKGTAGGGDVALKELVSPYLKIEATQ